MIKVSVLYPNGDNITFDQEYYCKNHLTMAREKMGDACKEITVDMGVAGIADMGPGAKAPFIAIGHLYFESVEAFQMAFVPHAKEILGDVANYTNSIPQIQISHIVM